MFSGWFLLAQTVTPPKVPASSISRWLTDPRHSVLIVLLLAIVIGGGRKWVQARRASRLKRRLQEPDPSEGEILEASKYGRDVLPELFSLLDPATPGPRRQAAGRALARLWAQDQLVQEEERALVVRGFRVDWRARRRYPRALEAPISLSVRFGVPFLGNSEREDPDEVVVFDQQLEWSCRIEGSERASLSTFSDWQPGQSVLDFEIMPQDFSGLGPHRLIFQARVRTRKLTSSWELDLPHVPMTIEFDPGLELDALRALPDESTGKRVRDSIRLIRPPESDSTPFLPIHASLVIRNPPVIEIGPRPTDLAHLMDVEFEGIEPRIRAGSLVVLGDAPTHTVPIRLEERLPETALDRPGEYRLRVRLTPDSHRGWADPDVRSMWPESFETDWMTVQVIRS